MTFAEKVITFNRNLNYFKQVIPLEHPRYIMQYRLKQKEEYIQKFIRLFRQSSSLKYCR